MNTTATTTTEIFKFYKNSTLFDAQNAGNRVSELSLGDMPQTPLARGKGPYVPFSGHSRRLHLQWPLITNVIETSGVTKKVLAFGK